MTASRTDHASATTTAVAAGQAQTWRTTIISALCVTVEWLFTLVVAILPIDAYILLPGKQTGVFLSEALTAQAIVLFTLGYLLALRWRIPFPLSFPIRWLAPLAALLGASLISLAFAHARGVGLRECAQYAFFLVLFLLAVAVAGQRGIRNRVFWAILIGYYVVIILGLLGTLTNLPDIAQIVLGIQRNTATLPGTLAPRAESTFRFPDELNSYLLLVLPFLLACVFTARSRVERVTYSVYVALGLWLLILTYARSALIIIVIITPLLLYLLRGLRLSLIGILVVLLGLGAALARDPALLARGASLLDSGNAGYTYRLQTWQWALSAFAHHPLFGVGPRNLQFWPGAPWADAYLLRREDNGENSYINTLADLGIVGFTTLMFCIVAGIRRLRSGLADHSSWLARSWHIGFLVGFCALLLDSFAHPTVTSTQVTALLCAFVGLAGRYPQAVEVEPDEYDIARARMATWKPLDLAASAVALQSRVVFLINSAGFGGGESHCVNLASELHRHGARVLVVCPPGSPLPPTLKAQGIPYRVLALGMPVGRIKGLLGTLEYYFNPFSRRESQSRILALAVEERSIFVCPFPREQLLATPICQTLKTPVIWGIYSPMEYLPHRLLLRSTWHRRARQATAMFTVTEGFTWRLDEEGFPAQNLLVVRNAIPEQAILEPGAASATPGRLVVAARLNRRKGVQYAIKALAQLAANHPEAHLVVVGAGPYERSLRRLAQRSGVQERVRFLGYQSNLQAILSTASVVLCPSVEQEVLPTAIIEAFGVAAPVVASRVGGIPQVVKDGVTGLLVAPGDANALARAIGSLLDDPERARTLGTQGQDLVRSGYNLTQVGDRFLRILTQVERGEPLSAPLSDVASVSGEMRAIHRPRLLGNVGLFAIAKAMAALATALWT
ncbi:MAG: glycosyltransferase, partial [Chloroflexota bacterium]|nr:glycosyltransferase [Chloroflexota bacterium]